MPAGWIGFDPQRIVTLHDQVVRAVEDLARLRSEDLAVRDALGDVAIARQHLEHRWLPLLERIRASTAMSAPMAFAAGRSLERDVPDDAEAAAIAAYMGAGRLDLTPAVPSLPADASEEERAVQTFVYGPWRPTPGAAEAMGDALMVTRDTARVVWFDERDCVGDDPSAGACAIGVTGVLPIGKLARIFSRLRWGDEAVDVVDSVPVYKAPDVDVPSDNLVVAATGDVIDRSTVGTTISAQRQARHVVGTPQHRSGGYFTAADQAQAVLDAFHDGSAEVLGISSRGHIVVRVDDVTGFNTNPGVGFHDQPSNIFFIKGTTRPSVVPTSPTWGG